MPPGICLTPATIAAAVSLVEMGIRLSMYKDLRDMMYQCAIDAMETAEELFEKRKSLLDAQAVLYEKLCDIPDADLCVDATMCAREYTKMNQFASAIEKFIPTLDCYQIGAGREFIRAALVEGAKAAVATKVDGCIIEDKLQDARTVLQAGAAVSSPSAGNEYYSLANSYQQVGVNLTAQLNAQAAGFNAASQVFGFAVGQMFENYESQNRPDPTPATAPVSPALNPGRPYYERPPDPDGFFGYYT